MAYDLTEASRPPNTGERADSTVRVLIRVLGAGLLCGLVLLLFSLATGGSSASTAPVSVRVAITMVSGVLYVAVLAPLALRLQSTTGWAARWAILFATLYVTGTLTDLLEAYFYTTLLTLFTLAAALIVGAIPALVVAAITAAVVRPGAPLVPQGPGIHAFLRQRSPLDLAWRLVLAGVLYVPVYFGFGALVTPVEHQFYNDPAFIAQLHTQVPPDSVAYSVEAVRGVFFALALLPALAVMPQRRWWTLAYLTLIGVVIEAWVPLLAQTSWPLAMRLGNVAELTGDAFCRAFVAMALFAQLPGLRAQRLVGSEVSREMERSPHNV